MPNKKKGTVGQQKRRKALKNYNDLLQMVTKEFKKRPDLKGISIKERRKIVSKELYPKYKDAKGLPKRSIAKQLVILIDSFNPFLIPNDYIGLRINFWEIDSSIEDLVAYNTDVEVCAGRLGNASFNTNNYDYVSSGVQEIVTQIRELVDNESGRADSYFLTGRRVKNGKKDNGEPDSYYIIYEFYYNGDNLCLNTDAISTLKKNKEQIAKSNEVGLLLDSRVIATRKKQKIKPKPKMTKEKKERIGRLNKEVSRYERLLKGKKVKAGDKQFYEDNIFALKQLIKRIENERKGGKK